MSVAVLFQTNCNSAASKTTILITRIGWLICEMQSIDELNPIFRQTKLKHLRGRITERRKLIINKKLLR